jgi:hypothetical protein
MVVAGLDEADVIGMPLPYPAAGTIDYPEGAGLMRGLQAQRRNDIIRGGVRRDFRSDRECSGKLGEPIIQPPQLICAHHSLRATRARRIPRKNGRRFCDKDMLF